MPIHYDVETDYLYMLGFRKGLQIGVERGLKIVKEKELLKIDILVIRDMLKKELNIRLIADIVDKDISYVSTVQKKLLQEKKIVARLKKKQKVKKISKALNVSKLLVEVIKEEVLEK